MRADVGLSVQLSGIGLGLCQTISLRSHQPSACSASATRAGIIIRSFGLRPEPRALATMRDAATVSSLRTAAAVSRSSQPPQLVLRPLA